MDTLVARVIASALFKADAPGATTCSCRRQRASTTSYERNTYMPTLHASVVKARQAELDTLLAMSATFLQTLSGA
jgi:hypothetical protein